MTVSSSKESLDWFIGEHKDEGRPLVVRCPEHITQWCFWLTGIPYSLLNQAWVREVKLRDASRPVWRSYFAPYSLEPEDFAARIAMAQRFKVSAYRRIHEDIANGRTP